jgi:hypothetical protein
MSLLDAAVRESPNVRSATPLSTVTADQLPCSGNDFRHQVPFVAARLRLADEPFGPAVQSARAPLGTVQSLQSGDDEPQSEYELLFQRNGQIVGDCDGGGIASGIELVERRR